MKGTDSLGALAPRTLPRETFLKPTVWRTSSCGRSTSVSLSEVCTRMKSERSLDSKQSGDQSVSLDHVR